MAAVNLCQHKYVAGNLLHTILFKIIAHMNISIFKLVGGLQLQLSGIAVTVSLVFQQNAVTGIIPLRNFEEFLQLQLDTLMVLNC